MYALLDLVPALLHQVLLKKVSTGFTTTWTNSSGFSYQFLLLVFDHLHYIF